MENRFVIKVKKNLKRNCELFDTEQIMRNTLHALHV